MIKIELNNFLSTNIENLPGEIWKDISGYNERYLVSNYGRIKSVVKKKPIILKKKFNKGRFEVVLSLKKGMQKKEVCGRLVASAFIREPLINEVLAFGTGGALNDSVGNLKWITKKESTQNAIKRGSRLRGMNKGEKNGMAELAKEDVLKIRELKQSGSTYKQLSGMYGVSVPCIQKVVQNRSWR
ncbi:NUMOD4 domain-containing protein [Chryseobacterium sp.]|uniref:NUMOD4 domain-containing protein n=1 Tax=Chryseobacterium sp. TaxID=1871047 RepID=UPI00321C277C